MISYLLLLAAWGVVGVQSKRMPNFSWQNGLGMSFFHSCNENEWTQKELEFMAQFPMVTIEKAEGLFRNGTAESKISATLAAVKKLNESVFGVAYQNSVLAWEFYTMSTEVAKNKSLQLTAEDGKPVLMHGDGSFPQPSDGMYVYDMGNSGMRDLYIQDCLAMTKAGLSDGCFADRATKPSFSQKVAPAVLDRYYAGHIQVLQDLQTALDANGGGVVIANNLVVPNVRATMLESFAADEASINALQSAAKQGIVVQAHAGYHPDGSDNRCDNITNAFGAFLMGAEQYSYFACTRGWIVGPGAYNESLVWHPILLKPIGEPLGPAVKLSNGTYTRSFSLGTTVLFDTIQNAATFFWGN